jgi:hypothetical protein
MVEKKKSETACQLVRERRDELAKKAKEATPQQKEQLRHSITERLRSKNPEPAPAPKNGKD